MVTYEQVQKTQDYKVFLNKKQVGMIKNSSQGWQYFPKNQKTGGEVFPTLGGCKRSIEGDE